MCRRGRRAALERVQALRRGHRRRQRRARHRRPRVHGPARSVRLRQVDAAADGRRAGGPDGRRDLHRRPAGQRRRPRSSGTSRWCSRAMRSIRTRPCRPTSSSRSRSRRVGNRERSHAARDAAQLLGLTELLGRKPGALSGGQRQRVALARAIVRNPAVFCMDEPLSNLDAKLRGETRAELIALHQRVEGTLRLRDPRPGRGHDHGHPCRGHAAGCARAGRTRRKRSTTSRPASSSPSSSARRR